MSITFKQFAALIAEGKESYSSYSSWADAAELAGYKVKKLSGERRESNQTWAAFDDKDQKCGEFAEQEDSRGGWLRIVDDTEVNEVFGLFRNNDKLEKAKAEREKLKKDTADMVSAHRAKQAKKNGQGKGDDVEDEEDEKKKKNQTQTRSASTKGTKSTQSQAGARHAERDWVSNM